MKKTAVLIAALLLTLVAASAQALTMTGLETDAVSREWESNLFFARMQEMTGVAVEPHGVTDSKEYDKLLAGMLEGNVPVDVLFKADITRSQEIALLDAGAIIDLAPLIEENMPNLSALLEAHPEWREVMTLEDGRIATLPQLNDQARGVCLWINEAWLSALGLEMPGTTQELTQALLAFRDKDPNANLDNDEIAVDMTGVWELRWLLSFFGVAADDYNIARVDGKAVFAPEMPQYRAFVEYLADWYAQGLLTPDTFTGLHGTAALAGSSEEKKTRSGIMLSPAPYTHVPVEAMTEYSALLIPDENGNTVWRDMLGSVWTGAFAVTSACSDPAAALRWADMLYSEEGALLAYAGVEGEDYFFNEAGNWEFVVDAFRTVESIRSTVIMYTGATMPGLVPNGFLAKVDSAPDLHIIEQNDRVRAVSVQVTPAYALDASAQARANELAMTLTRLVDTGIGRFVTGETELNDENWAAWLESLRAAGSEELTALFNGI